MTNPTPQEQRDIDIENIKYLRNGEDTFYIWLDYVYIANMGLDDEEEKIGYGWENIGSEVDDSLIKDLQEKYPEEWV